MKLFWRKSSKNLEQLNCYRTIEELPIRVWFEIHKDGDYTKLLKVDVKLTDETIFNISKVWTSIYNEYIEKFGLSDEFMSELRTEIKIANLRADLVITGQRYLNTLIKIEEEKKKLNELEIKEPNDLETVLAKMSKYYGFKLSSRELTVNEYYSYLNNILNGKN